MDGGFTCEHHGSWAITKLAGWDVVDTSATATEPSTAAYTQSRPSGHWRTPVSGLSYELQSWYSPGRLTALTPKFKGKQEAGVQC